MNKIAVISMLSLIVGFTACSPDESVQTGEAQLSFKLEYGGNPLVVDAAYDYQSNSVRFSEFNFIYSNLKLLRADGSSIDLEEVGYLDFGDTNTEESAVNGLNKSFVDLPMGSYTGISFTYGLDDSYLNKTPADFSTDNVLSNAGLYWVAWGNYIICKLEARFESNGDGLYDDASFQYHLGGDTAYRTVTIDREFDLITDGITSIDLVLDLRKILLIDNELIDPFEFNNTHTSDMEWLISDLLDNVQTEFVAE